MSWVRLINYVEKSEFISSIDFLSQDLIRPFGSWYHSITIMSQIERKGNIEEEHYSLMTIGKNSTCWEYKRDRRENKTMACISRHLQHSTTT